jgi:glycine/D-amino acid oxidase-like deaminating enzyme
VTSRELDLPDPGATRSFWLQEALAADPGDPCPPLTDTVAADVCIVGGGFAGLWSAVELARREPSMRIALLEQDICGGGASGRNGGFFSSSWWDAPAICALVGEREGLRYLRVLADAVIEVGDWLAAHGIDAWYHGEGLMGIRAAPWQAGPAGDDAAAFLAARGLGDRIRSLGVEEARAIADAPGIVEARMIDDNAIVQPARLARGLRRAALAAGVAIFERTAVTEIDRSRPAVVRTEQGAIRADQVVLTTGSWAASWPGFRRSIAVIVDNVVVTEPIPDRLEEIGWTSQIGIADGRELLYYLRPTDDGRIAIGGGSVGVVFGGRASGRAVTHARPVAEVAARGLLELFPQLADVRFTHAWGGPIDQTMSFLPFFTTRAPGNVHAGLGFSGHGLSQTMVGGRILASLVLGSRDEWSSLPVVGPPRGSVPPEPLRYPLARLAGWALRSGDLREDAGEPRGWVRERIGDAPLAARARLAARASRT